MASRWYTFDPLNRWGPHASRFPKAPGVYVVYFGQTPVYVGQSNNVAARISGHRFRHGYNRVIHTPWEDVPDCYPITVKVKLSKKLGEWAMDEIRLIAKLKPMFNVHHRSKKAVANA